MVGETKGSELHNYSNSVALSAEGQFRYDPVAKKMVFRNDTEEKTLQEESSMPSDGAPILVGRVLANGTINLNVDYGSGAGFSVVKYEDGGYDITLTGITASNVHIDIQMNDNSQSRSRQNNGATAKGVDTGFPTPTGFRARFHQLNDNTGGGAGVLSYKKQDTDFSFTVIKIN